MVQSLTRKGNFSQHWLCLLVGLPIATGGKGRTLRKLCLRNLQKFTRRRHSWSQWQSIGESGKMKLLEELLFVFYHLECYLKSLIWGSLRAGCTGLVRRWQLFRLVLWTEQFNLVSVQQRKYWSELRESKWNRQSMKVTISWSPITS